MTDELLTSKEPWPANPIGDYKTIESGSWGFMYFYSGGKAPVFVPNEQPSDHEIIERWGYRLLVE